MKLLSYHNDPKIKRKYLNRVRRHRMADEIIHGTYWQNGKGCAVGCTIHSGSHANYKTELGIPVVIARMEDFLFERMKNGDSMTWPERFLDAIPVGANLGHVHGKFFAMTLLDDEIGFWKVWNGKEDQKAFKDFGNFINFLATDKPFDKKEWEAVRHPFLASLGSLASLDSFDSFDRLARLARLASLDGLASFGSLASLDSFGSLASFGSLVRLDSLDSFDRLDRVARLDSLDRLDVYKIASERLLGILKEAK